MFYQNITLFIATLLIIISVILCRKSLSYKNYKIRVSMYFGLDKKLCLKSFGNSLEVVKLDIENTIATNIDNIIEVQDSLIPYLIDVHIKDDISSKKIYYSREISKFLISNEYLSVLEKNIKDENKKRSKK